MELTLLPWEELNQILNAKELLFSALIIIEPTNKAAFTHSIYAWIFCIVFKSLPWLVGLLARAVLGPSGEKAKSKLEAPKMFLMGYNGVKIKIMCQKMFLMGPLFKFSCLLFYFLGNWNIFWLQNPIFHFEPLWNLSKKQFSDISRNLGAPKKSGAQGKCLLCVYEKTALCSANPRKF